VVFEELDFFNPKKEANESISIDASF
jgi:hypothetical protein